MCNQNHHECSGPRWGIFRIIGFTIGGVALAVLFGFLFGWFVQLLWNWLMPNLFGLKMITYWQGFGLVVLAKILFGGGHGYGHHGRRHRDKFWNHHHKHLSGGNEEDAWKPHGSYKNWKYYDQYWRDEGKAAFEAYLDKMEKEKNV
jgi:hypothetical protein